MILLLSQSPILPVNAEINQNKIFGLTSTQLKNKSNSNNNQGNRQQKSPRRRNDESVERYSGNMLDDIYGTGKRHGYHARMKWEENRKK